MKLKSLISLIPLSLLALPATAQDSTGVSSEIVYGVIDLDNIYMNTANFDQQISMANFKYYFTPLKASNSPYEIQAQLERVSSISTNMTWYLGSAFNIVGKQYFEGGIDVHYTYAQTSNLTFPDFDSGDDNLTGVHVNYQILDKLKLGAGIVSAKDEYYAAVGFWEWEKRTNNKMEYRASASYQNINQGKGWFVEGLISSGSQSKNDDTTFSSHIEAQYFLDQKNSYRFKVGTYIDDSATKDSFFSLGISKKRWYDFNKSMDVGLSYIHLNEEDDEFDTSRGINFVVFDINGTWRF